MESQACLPFLSRGEFNPIIKPKRQIKRDQPDELSVPVAIKQIWSMDFISNSLNDGRRFRTFNLLDEYNREGLGIEVDISYQCKILFYSILKSEDQVRSQHTS